MLPSMNQLDQLRQKKGKSKIGSKDPLNVSLIEVEGPSAKSVQNREPPFESPTSKHCEVVEIISDSDIKMDGSSDTLVMSKEHEKKNALEQFSNIPTSGRRKRKATLKKRVINPIALAKKAKMDIKKTESKESLSKSNTAPINVESTEGQPKAQADKDINPEVLVKKHGSIFELQLTPQPFKVNNTFTLQLMNEVVKQLDLFKTDDNCKVVFLTSSGPHFCQGVDFYPLTVGTAENRKSAAIELAASIRNFLQALASFPKPLLAGITGTISGLGVTMLPLFDIVISSDRSTFETSYAKIGQIPEGHCILTLTNNVKHNYKTRLLWLCEKINSTEAGSSGLVTMLTSPSKIPEHTLLYAKKVAALSQQTFSSMKSLRQKNELSKLVAALAKEQKILVRQWTSAECQEKFKQFMEKNSW